MRQSYPESYPFENNPKTGSNIINLPKTCSNSFYGGQTTLYKIEKGFKQLCNAVIIRFYDELYQPNAIDDFGVNQSKCDESWSMDNLKSSYFLRIMKYKFSILLFFTFFISFSQVINLNESHLIDYLRTSQLLGKFKNDSFTLNHLI